MSALNNSLLLGAPAGGATGYSISRSLRFNAPDSAYLSRTPASAGNRKTWTWAGWVKKATNGNVLNSFFAASTPSYYDGLTFGYNNADTLALNLANSAGNGNDYGPAFETTQVFCDPSAWYHIVLAIDTTQSTASNRVRVYVNGTQITAFATTNYPAQNYETNDFNTAQIHYLGAAGGLFGGRFFSGLLADCFFIDSQALDCTAFGEFSATTGVWVPKAYSGPAATGNSFWLPFSDNSAATATTLGNDNFNLGNNFTPNNLSVTAGAGNDSLIDVPVNGSEVDTGLGNQVRGNYCTLNPLAAGPGATLSNGNLECTTNTADFGQSRGTIGVSTGKWYWEVSKVSGADICVGVVDASTSLSAFIGNAAKSYGYYGYDGKKVNNSTQSSYGASYGVGDIIGVALDLDNGTIAFYKNNVAQGTAFTGLSGTFFPAASDDTGGNSGVYVFNFGARSFAYQAPAGFKSLNTASLPAPVVTKPSTVMDVLTWTGNSASSRALTGLGFSPDFVWIKDRSNGYNHVLFDAVRGAGGSKVLFSNRTTAEGGGAGEEGTNYGTITSFDSSGFTVAPGAVSSVWVNQSSDAYVGWTWDAGNTTVTNTQGSITSQVRANASAGFSIVSYTGGGNASDTVGHGLGVAPVMYFVKNRDDGTKPFVCFTTLTGIMRYAFLNSTMALNAPSQLAPTSTVLDLYPDGYDNAAGQRFVAYCFAPVNSYSSFGSYVGNGQSGDSAPFIWTGFRPRWVMVKASSSDPSGGGWWNIIDAGRNGYNVATSRLGANSSTAENSSYNWMDLLSNGFKLRELLDGSNVNGVTYIYAAFAESPFAVNNRAR